MQVAPDGIIRGFPQDPGICMGIGNMERINIIPMAHEPLKRSIDVGHMCATRRSS